jgi:hypothetical protein
VPELSGLASPMRIPCRNCVRSFIEEQVAILSHHWLFTHIRRTMQKVMEVVVPPLTILHPNYRLLCAELRSNPCRRSAGRPIPHLSLFRHSHAETALRQSNRNQSARYATTDDNDVLSGRGACHVL